MQLLHQAATLQLKWCLFLVSHEYGKVIHGAWIYFSNVITDYYMVCLQDIKHTCLRFVYEALDNFDSCLLTCILDEEEATFNASIKQQTLCQVRWLQIQFQVMDSHSLAWTSSFSSNRILLLIASTWNRSKNGSDIAPGMIRNSYFPLPLKARSMTPFVKDYCIEFQRNIGRIDVSKKDKD